MNERMRAVRALLTDSVVLHLARPTKRDKATWSQLFSVDQVALSVFTQV